MCAFGRSIGEDGRHIPGAVYVVCTTILGCVVSCAGHDSREKAIDKVDTWERTA